MCIYILLYISVAWQGHRGDQKKKITLSKISPKLENQRLTQDSKYTQMYRIFVYFHMRKKRDYQTLIDTPLEAKFGKL